MRAYTKSLVIGLVLMGLLTVAGCTASRTNTASDAQAIRGVAPSYAPAPPSAPAAQPAPRQESAGRAVTQSYSAADAQAQTETRLIVRTGEVAIVVSNVEETRDKVQKLAEGVGGYVSTANLFRNGDQLQGTIQIRVPAAQYEAVKKEIMGMGRVENERGNSNDVTEEFTDLNARMRNLEATEKELLTLLNRVQERSSKAEDIVAIYRELTNIRGEIERLKGRINFLEKSAALATLTVSLLPNPINRPVLDESWAPARTLRDAQRALVRTFQGLGDLAIWALIWGLPVALVVAVPLAVVVWVFRRWRRNRAQTRLGAAGK